jgi:hypothetical protein
MVIRRHEILTREAIYIWRNNVVHSYKHWCHDNANACSLSIVDIAVNNVINTESVATDKQQWFPFVALRTRMSLQITFRALCKVADILSDLTKFKCSRLIFTKSLIKLQVNPFSGRRPDTYGRAAGCGHDEANRRFSQVCKLAYNCSS